MGHAPLLTNSWLEKWDIQAGYLSILQWMAGYKLWSKQFGFYSPENQHDNGKKTFEDVSSIRMVIFPC